MLVMTQPSRRADEDAIDGFVSLATLGLIVLALDDITTDAAGSGTVEWAMLAVGGAWFVTLAGRLWQRGSERLAAPLSLLIAAAAVAITAGGGRPGTGSLLATWTSVLAMGGIGLVLLHRGARRDADPRCPPHPGPGA